MNTSANSSTLGNSAKSLKRINTVNKNLNTTTNEDKKSATSDSKNDKTLKKTQTVKNMNTNSNQSLQRSATKGELTNNKIKNKTPSLTNTASHKNIVKPKENEKVSVFLIDSESNFINTESISVEKEKKTMEDTKLSENEKDSKKEKLSIVQPKNIEKLNYFKELLDLNKLIFVHKYLNKTDLIALFPAGKKPGRLSLQLLLDAVRKEMEESDSKLNSYKLKVNSDKTIPSEYPTFNMSRGANRAVELLNENIYNKIFSVSYKPNDDIILVYRIFFYFINKKEIAECQNPDEFWKGVSEFFYNEGQGKTGIIF